MRYERTGRNEHEIVEVSDVGDCCGQSLDRRGVHRGVLRCEAHGDHRTFTCSTCATIACDPPHAGAQPERIGSEYFGRA